MTGKNYRITVLTDRLIRLEYQKDGRFEDRLTRMVVNRDFPKIEYSERRTENGIVIQTDELRLVYDGKPFSSDGLIIKVKSMDTIWHYGIVYGNSDRNLLGTARTLDLTDGFTELDPGLFGHNGYAVIDDSNSPVMVPDTDGGYGMGSSFKNREDECIDIYFFGYGKDFYGGLKDFAMLSGRTPMLPRYALGNWWSRYYKYTDESYMKVLNMFKEERIPLSVAVIDMDWHLTQIDPKYGTGWTGYTWNREYFPEPEDFLGRLHDRKLAVTLNLHPADGIRAFEDMYDAVAERMGTDPATEKPVEFDFSSRRFRDAYFEEIMHPYEEKGVDFWWIDWQQGTGSGKNDVDPLFLLNHYHYHDMEGRNIRPMIFSRYAGVGSHRYPVGFSGDTRITWRSLAYQPFFTSTASNIGYGWWSHDIGGHMLGDKDMERLIRWIQFGVFSPVMRLHSSNSEFLNKEPWSMEEPYRSITGKFMRLRHQLIPYLYTENYRAYKDSKPLIRPMYYDHPDEQAAYRVPNEYGFGDNLIVAAITERMDRELRLACVNTFIPEGRYYDISNGRIYEGKKHRKLYRKLDEIPVLLKAGGIVPVSLEDKKNGTDNPSETAVYVGSCANGEYMMYEDDGMSMNYLNGKYVTTGFSVTYDRNESGYVQRFTIDGAKGDLSLIPGVRSYKVTFYGIRPAKDSDVVCMRTDGNSDVNNRKYENWICKTEYDPARNTVTVCIMETDVQTGICLELTSFVPAVNDQNRRVFEILDNAWIDNVTKDMIYNSLISMDGNDFKEWLRGENVSEILKDAISEILQ